MRNRKNIKPKKKYALIVDGETEFWYLQMLKRNESLTEVDIDPKIPERKTLKAQYDKVIELSKAKDYNKIYWIIDFDVILNDKNTKSKSLEEFKSYQNEINKKHKNVLIIINNPCLEFWFLLHYEATTKPFSNCDGANNALKKHINGYSKSQHYFTKQNNDIYLKLKPYLQTALQNAKSIISNIDDLDSSRSEMFKLFDDLGLSK